MTTFSQLVDTAIVMSSRNDLVAQAASWLNQTIREFYLGENGMPVVFDEDRLEFSLTGENNGAGAMTYVWDIPEANRLQFIETVQYAYYPVNARRRSPGHSPELSRFSNPDELFYYYQTGQSLACVNYGLVGAEIKVSLFQFPKSLVYYRKDERPAVWSDVDQGFEYHPRIVGESNAALEAISTNWLLMRHRYVLLDGVLAKIFKRLADKERAAMYYSSYMSNMRSIQMSAGRVLAATNDY